MTERTRRLGNTHTRVRWRLASDDRLVASVRRGDVSAFEAMYDRHAAELLSFCVYMLSCRSDAEDAVQATFAAAYRALRADERPVALRAWLFAIARNQCLTILRRRRPTVELNGEPALRGDPARELELREEVRDALVRLGELPERQRAAMILAELRGLSQAEIGSVLGVRADQVKALVYQARSDLISERRAREADCHEIREELSAARGAALLRGRLRRHVRSCEDCRSFADGVARQRRQFAAVLAPSLMLKLRSLPDVFAGWLAEPTAYAGGATLGGTVAAAGLGFASGGVKAIAVKVMAGAAILGLSASVGAAVVPSQPITRLAGEIAPAGGGSHSQRHALARAGVAHRTRLAQARYLAGVQGAARLVRSGPEGGVPILLLRGHGNSVQVEPGGGQEAGSGSGGDGHAPGLAAARARADHSSRRAERAAASAERKEARVLQKEARLQRRGEHELLHEERKQQHVELKAYREERKRAAEAQRANKAERQHETEQPQHEAEQPKHERENSGLSARERERAKHIKEREHLDAQHQRERERAKLQTERERTASKRQHEHERSARQRQLQRERRERQRSKRGRQGPPPRTEEEKAGE